MRILVLNTDRRNFSYNFERLFKGVQPDAEVLTLVDYKHGEAFDAAVSAFASKKDDANASIKIDAIIAAGEGDVLLAADLRKKYDVRGMKPSEAIRYRDKVVMKTLARDAGHNLPKFAPIPTKKDAYRFVEANGYPVAVKPRKAVSAIGVYKCSNKAELDRALDIEFADLNNDPDYMIESWAKGEILHLDGYVVEGAPVVVWPTLYSRTCYDYSVTANVLWDTMLESPPAGTIEFARKLIADFGLVNSTFHLEIFWDPTTGNFQLCEIAARTGGDLIAYLWGEAFGLHLDDVFFLLQAGLDYPRLQKAAREFQSITRPPKAVAYVLFPRQNGILVRSSNKPTVDGVRVVHSLVRHNRYESWKALSNVAMRALVVAKDWKELELKKPEVEKWYFSTHEWKPHSIKSAVIRGIRKLSRLFT